jgi:hypothetical protein
MKNCLVFLEIHCYKTEKQIDKQAVSGENITLSKVTVYYVNYVFTVCHCMLSTSILHPNLNKI